MSIQGRPKGKDLVEFQRRAPFAHGGHVGVDAFVENHLPRCDGLGLEPMIIDQPFHGKRLIDHLQVEGDPDTGRPEHLRRHVHQAPRDRIFPGLLRDPGFQVREINHTGRFQSFFSDPVPDRFCMGPASANGFVFKWFVF